MAEPLTDEDLEQFRSRNALCEEATLGKFFLDRLLATVDAERNAHETTCRALNVAIGERDALKAENEELLTSSKEYAKRCGRLNAKRQTLEDDLDEALDALKKICVEAQICLPHGESRPVEQYPFDNAVKAGLVVLARARKAENAVLKQETATNGELGQYVRIDPEAEEVVEKWWIHDKGEDAKALVRLNEWLAERGERQRHDSCVEAAIRYADALKARIDYLEDELSQCELCDRSLLVSKEKAAQMEAEDPDTARAAGSVELVICGHCWDEVCRERNALEADLEEALDVLWGHKEQIDMTWSDAAKVEAILKRNGRLPEKE
jgi:hypothetical protein